MKIDDGSDQIETHTLPTMPLTGAPFGEYLTAFDTAHDGRQVNRSRIEIIRCAWQSVAVDVSSLRAVTCGSPGAASPIRATSWAASGCS